MTFLNKSLWIDEWYSNLTSLIISEKWIPLYDSWHWDGSYLVFHYLQAIMFKIFWYSPEISRVLPIILGFLSLYFIYRISKIVFENKIVAYLSVFVTFFSYYYIVAITQARYYSMMILFFLFWIYFILKFYKLATIRNFFIALNISFFAIIFHVYLYSLLVILWLVLLFLFFEKKIYKSIILFINKNYKIITLWIINFALFYIIMKFLNPGQSTSSISQTILLAKLDYTDNYMKFFLYNYWLFFIITFFWIFYAIFSKKSKEIFILLFSFWFPFLVISKFVFMYATRYVYFLIPLVVIIWTWIIYLIYSNLKNKYLKNFFIILMLLISIFFFPTKYNFDFKNPIYMNDPYAPEANFKWAYESIKNDPDFWESAKIISVFPHMDYLYLWKSDYYIYVDETWVWFKPENSFYVKKWVNIFTKAKIILSLYELKNYEKNHVNFIILDQLWLNRLRNSDLLNYIEHNYQTVYEDKRLYNIIKVYKKWIKK